MQNQTPGDGARLLTVREFANAAGVTCQAIYARLDKDLSSYLTSKGGRKYVRADALQLFTCQAVDKQLSSNLTSTCQPLVKQLSSTCQANQTGKSAEPGAGESPAADADALRRALDDLRKQVQTLTAERDTLRTERDALRERCAELRDRSAEDAATVRALSDALHAEQAQSAALVTALQAAQALHAGALHIAMQGDAPAVDAPAVDLTGGNQSESQSDTRRGHFLRDLFRRRGKKKEPPQQEPGGNQ